MSFAEVQFPPDIAYGSTGGPEFSTDIVETYSGHEQRNSNWAEARIHYNVASGVKTAEQLALLIAFFRARRGQAEGFRFKDWTDYNATAELLGQGDGTVTDFQLLKRYSNGGVSRNRALTKPVAESVKLYLDGELQLSGYTLDATTGIVTFNAAPANGVEVTADCEFDVPVRFATDRLSARLQDYGAYSTQDIPLIEVRI